MTDLEDVARRVDKRLTRLEKSVAKLQEKHDEERVWRDFYSKLIWAILAIVGANLVGFHVFDGINLFGHP
jgi:hypothetical protein